MLPYAGQFDAVNDHGSNPRGPYRVIRQLGGKLEPGSARGGVLALLGSQTSDGRGFGLVQKLMLVKLVLTWIFPPVGRVAEQQLKFVEINGKAVRTDLPIHMVEVIKIIKGLVADDPDIVFHALLAHFGQAV